MRIEAALHQRQEDQVRREVELREDLLDHRPVAFEPVQPDLEAIANMEGEELDVLVDLGRPHDRNVEVECFLHDLERVGRRNFEQRRAGRTFHHGRRRRRGPVDAECRIQGNSEGRIANWGLFRFGPRLRQYQGSAQMQSLVQAVPIR